MLFVRTVINAVIDCADIVENFKINVSVGTVRRHYIFYVQPHNTEFAYRGCINRTAININIVFSTTDIFFESSSAIKKSLYHVSLQLFFPLYVIISICKHVILASYVLMGYFRE